MEMRSMVMRSKASEVDVDSVPPSRGSTDWQSRQAAFVLCTILPLDMRYYSLTVASYPQAGDSVSDC